MSANGYIHSIETFGTVDGPGIRYVVFLQGCPLQCKYCHNRDTWNMAQGKQVSAHEIIKDIEKYLNFYKQSGGGITASGGEPALQPDFVTEVFRLVKEMNLNTALDTSGYVEFDRIKFLMEVTDLVLLDIKTLDNRDHLDLTGVSNEKILNFAQVLNEINKPVWIRYVLIPEVNDSADHLASLADLVKGLGNINNVEVLGYHKLGVHKWQLCSEEDPLAHVRPASTDQVEKAREYLRASGVKVVH